MGPLRIFAVWIVVSCFTAATLAVAFGFRDIWSGSRDAFLSYLVPMPIVAGVFHVPSLIVIGAIVSMAPRYGPSMRRLLRFALLATLLAALFVAWDGYHPKVSEHYRPDSVFEWLGDSIGHFKRDRLALFVGSDALLAMLFLAFVPGPRSRGVGERGLEERELFGADGANARARRGLGWKSVGAATLAIVLALAVLDHLVVPPPAEYDIVTTSERDDIHEKFVYIEHFYDRREQWEAAREFGRDLYRSDSLPERARLRVWYFAEQGPAARRERLRAARVFCKKRRRDNWYRGENLLARVERYC